jgi:hypothetical protein
MTASTPPGDQDLPLPPFAVGVRDAVLAAYPEWSAHARTETWKGGEPYLVIEVPTPTDALPLRLDTDGEEVTVSYDYYHAHFERWTPEPEDTRWQSALLFVRDLLAEHVAAATWWQDARIRVGSAWEPGTPLESGLSLIPHNRVRVRSWLGTHDADITS